MLELLRNMIQFYLLQTRDIIMFIILEFALRDITLIDPGVDAAMAK